MSSSADDECAGCEDRAGGIGRTSDDGEPRHVAGVFRLPSGTREAAPTDDIGLYREKAATPKGMPSAELHERKRIYTNLFFVWLYPGSDREGPIRVTPYEDF